MARNYWLEEVRIKHAATLLQTLLNDEFEGTQPDPQAWLRLIEDLIDSIYAGDYVVLDGLMRYEIVCTLDEYGLIEQLLLVEKN